MNEIRAVKRAVKLREWSQLISECRSSGLTVSAWCQKNGMTEDSYYYKLRVIRKAICEQNSGSRVFAELPALPSSEECRNDREDRASEDPVRITSGRFTLELTSSLFLNNLNVILEAMNHVQ